MYVCMSCLGTGSLACHGATRAWAELIAASDPLSVHGYREVNPCPVANSWPVASTHRSHLRHMSAVYHLTPPGDGEATPGDMAVQGAAPPGDTASLGAARGWPLPPPCAGYRTHHTASQLRPAPGIQRTGFSVRHPLSHPKQVLWVRVLVGFEPSWVVARPVVELGAVDAAVAAE